MNGVTSDPVRLHAEYVLSLRWITDHGGDELTAYLEKLAAQIDVTVVDGSPDELFSANKRRWGVFARHLPPEPRAGRNGKVASVMTGVRNARHESIVLADDDVRYDANALARIVTLLEDAEIVRPQNYFRPLPWHARWDTARTLINRGFASDYPGTLGVRKSALLAAGGYDGDVLFENLELIRTIRAYGGREIRADDLFVARIPATVNHFLAQRVRQAYDDFAQPVRLAVELALLPVMVLAVRRPRVAAGMLLAACGLAELGRRRAGGSTVFPATSALWAPLWIFERAFTVWLALIFRVTGGVHYAGTRIPRAGSRTAALRERLASVDGLVDDDFS